MSKQKSLSLVRYTFSSITFWVLCFVTIVLLTNFALLHHTTKLRSSQELVNAQERLSHQLSHEAETLSTLAGLLDQSSMLARTLRQNDLPALTAYLPALFNEAKTLYPALDQLEVIDKAGYLMGYVDSRGNQNSGRRRSPALQEALLSGKSEVGLEYILSSGKLYLEAAYPLRIGDELVGFVKIQADPAIFIPTLSKAIGVDLVLLTRRDVVKPPTTESKQAVPEVSHTLVASSLPNWKSRLLIEGITQPSRSISLNFEGTRHEAHLVGLKLGGHRYHDAEVLIVFDQSLYPNLFRDQLIIYLSLGIGIVLLLNLLLYQIFRRYVTTPLKGYTRVMGHFIRMDFNRAPSVAAERTVKEFKALEESIEQVGARMESTALIMRGCSNELNEQSASLKEYGNQLTASINQITGTIQDISESARKNSITVHDVPVQLSQIASLLTDAALDSRAVVEGAKVVRRQADLLRKGTAENISKE
jgi:hypothetical protein